jgi:hypothetical protein
MVSPSTIRFARFSFDYKLTHPENENSLEKIDREKKLLVDIINYEIDVTKLLKKGQKQYETLDKQKKEKLKIKKIETLIDDGEWKFGNVVEGSDFIFGKLAKITSEKKNIPDDKIKGFIETKDDKLFITNFLIDLKSHIIVYEVKKHIGSVSPTFVIRDIFNSYYFGGEIITFITLTDKRKIIERIKTLNQITTVKLSLKLPNPHSSELSKKFESYMNNWNARYTDITIKSKKGLKIDANDNLLMSGLSLAEDGFGKVTLKNEVEIDGKMIVQEIQSLRYPISKTIMLPDDDKKKIEALKQKIFDVDNSLLDEIDENITNNSEKIDDSKRTGIDSKNLKFPVKKENE